MPRVVPAARIRLVQAVTSLQRLRREMGRLSRKRSMLLGIIAFAVLLGLISVQVCGGGAEGPKSTKYAVTVTGTSGQTTRSSTVNVTVQ
jgi:hypothetical protein